MLSARRQGGKYLRTVALGRYADDVTLRRLRIVSRSKYLLTAKRATIVRGAYQQVRGETGFRCCLKLADTRVFTTTPSPVAAQLV